MQTINLSASAHVDNAAEYLQWTRWFITYYLEVSNELHMRETGQCLKPGDWLVIF